MSCEDEAGRGHGGHDNHHDHGGHDHGHSHDAPLDSTLHDNLYGEIDLPNVRALNAVGGVEAGRNVIKEWQERRDITKFCQSDVDDQLIITIPFRSSVSLKSILVKSGPGEETPTEMRLFRDKPGMDFSDAEDIPVTQKLDVVESNDVVEYQLRAVKWGNLSSLTLYFPNNVSNGENENTTIFYIGLRGTHQPFPQAPGVIIYESAARPVDHQLSAKARQAGGSHLGF